MRLPLMPIFVVIAMTVAPLIACAPAPPANQPVEIADESAVIVWDSASQTEHFIRRASFKTEAKDFGFLVPTPSQPQLAESDDAAFAELARITAPKIVQQPRTTTSGGCIGCASESRSVMMTDQKGVNVLEEKRVAGYDAVVLEADDAGALLKWLKEHGYEFSDSLKSWVDYYIKAKWKFTAFKIAKPTADRPVVSTSSVRMTFKTDKPFYPYREPVNQFPSATPTVKARLLRLFFISSERVNGTLNGKSWPGKPVWTNSIAAADREKLIGQLKLPAKTYPENWRVTEFEDHSTPRPATADVFFAIAADQSTIERPPHIQYVSSGLPGCLMCMLTCALAVGLHVFRRRGPITDARSPA